jgi:hypothetical protein
LPNGFGQISEIKNRKLRNPFRAMITVGKNTANKIIYGTVHFLCDYQSDVANLPTNRKPGSSAYVIENGNRYIFNSNHEWIL